jgi:hypothetical protein
VQPSDANALAIAKTPGSRTARRHAPDHLVTGHDLGTTRLEVPFHHVQIGATDAADLDPHQYLTGSRRRNRSLGELERMRFRRSRRS